MLEHDMYTMHLAKKTVNDLMMERTCILTK